MTCWRPSSTPAAAAASGRGRRNTWPASPTTRRRFPRPSVPPAILTRDRPGPVAAAEKQTRVLHLRCPHCRNPIELVGLAAGGGRLPVLRLDASGWSAGDRPGARTPSRRHAFRPVRADRGRRGRGLRHGLQGPRPAARPHRGHQGPSRRQPGHGRGARPLPPRGPQRRPVAAPGDRRRSTRSASTRACPTWSATSSRGLTLADC